MKSLKKELLAKGLIWQDQEGNWCKKCPVCSNSQHYWSYSICIDKLRTQTKCNSCAKSGKNNPSFGKSPSAITRHKLSISTKGKKRKPHTIETKLKISNTKHKDDKSLLSHNGNNQFKRKQYVFPDGRTEWIQGYEHWTLDRLLAESIPSSDIAINGDKRPVIKYKWSGSINNRYLPDCCIISRNTVVETKSTWTWESRLEQNKSKISGSIEAGYSMRVVIWGHDRKLVSDITYTNKNIP